MKSLSNFSSVFLIGYLFNSILMRLMGKIPMDDIKFPLIIIVLVSLSLLCFNYDTIKKKLKSTILNKSAFQ